MDSYPWLLVAAFVLFYAPPEAAAGKKGKWEKISTKGGVIVHRKSMPGSKLFAFRGETTAQIHIARLITIFSSPTQRKLWIYRYHSSGRIKKPSEFERVYWIRFDLPWPAWDRDYVFYTIAVPDPKKRVLTALIKSIKHKTRPKNKCCVRAFAKRTYWKFQAIKHKKGGKPKTRIIVEVHTDPKGWLPAWMINATQSDWPRITLKSLIRASRKAKHHPLLLNWHSPKPLIYPKAMVDQFKMLLKKRGLLKNNLLK